METTITKAMQKTVEEGGWNIDKVIKNAVKSERALTNEILKTPFTEEEKRIISIGKKKNLLLKQYWGNVEKLLPGSEFCYIGLLNYFKGNFEFDLKLSRKLAEMYHLLLIEATSQLDCGLMDEDGFFWFNYSFMESQLKMSQEQIQSLLKILEEVCGIISTNDRLIRLNIFENYDILYLYIDDASC